MENKDAHIYFNALTSLRGIFSIGIILFHISGQFERTAEKILGFGYNWGGYFGNCYFFILSGFLMAHTYRERILSENITLKKFLIIRLKKIYPLYFLSNAFMFIFGFIIYGPDLYFRPKDMIEIFLLICTGWIDDIYPWNTPGWFLSMLIFCYIIFYFIAKLYKKHEDFYYLLLFVFIFTGYTFLIKQLQIPFCYNHTGEGLFSFFIGVFLYDFIGWIDKFVHWKRIVLEIISSGILLLFIYVSYKYGLRNIVQEIYIVMNILLIPILIFLSLYLKFLKKIMMLKPIYWWGKISFSLCMWHIPVLHVYITLRNRITILQNINMNIQLLLYYLILTIVSLVSYYFIENRFKGKSLKQDSKQNAKPWRNNDALSP